MLLALLWACSGPPEPPPPPPLRIGLTHGTEQDIGRLTAALASVGAEPVSLTEPGSSLDGLDGLLLGPGADVDPRLYDELPHPTVDLLPPERQTLDLALAAAALERDLPVLGVCLGAQELAVVAGGSLVQDVPSEVVGALDHRAPHLVFPTNGSVLAKWYDDAPLVHSSHHQAIDAPGRHVTIAAMSPDRVVEAVELPDHLFAVGVQFHPEVDGDELEPQDGLWSAFADAARQYRDRGPATVAYTVKGTPRFPICKAVHSPFAGERRSLEALAKRKSGSFGDYRRSFIKGHKHGGIDLDGGFSEDVFAICPGVVVDRHLGFPHLTVVVEHRFADGSTLYSSYKHVADDDLTVAVGDRVTEQTRIGRLFDPVEYEASPFSTNHLHFELRHSIEDAGYASWTSMTMEELEQYATDPWAFFERELTPTR